MTLVTVTGRVWDGGRDPIDPVLQPRLWARPSDGAFLGSGLQTGTEVRASLNAATGAFSIDLESMPDLMWTFYLDWLVPGQENESPERRARGYEEWLTLWPGAGGDISGLMPNPGRYGILYGFGPPPDHLNDVVYLDITGPKVRVYGPADAYVGS